MTPAEWFVSLEDLTVEIEYQILKNFNISYKEVNDIDLIYAWRICEKNRDEKTYNDIFMMQLWGADPKQVPYFRDFMIRKDRAKQNVKAVMSTEEAQTYKGLFDRFLKKGGRK